MFSHMNVHPNFEFILYFFVWNRVSQPGLNFSYKAQVDDTMEEDTVSLPHQQSFSSLKTDSDYIYQVHTTTTPVTPCFHAPSLFHSQQFAVTSRCSNKSNKLIGSSVPKSILFREYSSARSSGSTPKQPKVFLTTAELHSDNNKEQKSWI